MSVADVFELADAYAAVAVAETAKQLGILDHLAKHPATAIDLAQQLGLDPPGTARVLMTLTVIGLLEQDSEGRFAVTPGATLLGMVQFWDGLAERLRSGAPPRPFDTPNGANANYPRAVGLMAHMMGTVPEEAATYLEAAGTDVLDVGAGATPWSLALARRNPDCRVTAVDRPDVLEVARRTVTDAGYGDSFSYLVADLSSDPLPPDSYDLAIAANVCHLFGDAANRKLVEKLFTALRPGGTVAVVDSTPDTPTSSRPALLHALSLLVRTSEGDVHPFSSYCAWLREAGFRNVERKPLSSPHPLSLMTAVKPLAPAVTAATG